MKNYWQELRQALAKASKVKDETTRKIKVAAIISDALRKEWVEPTLVGGLAVEFYTKGHYLTGDIDMVVPHSRKLEQVMTELGFIKTGRLWKNEKTDIIIEFPGSGLGENERFEEVDADGYLLKIISKEDLIIDRLCAFKHWKYLRDGANAFILLDLYQDELDKKHLVIRARQEDVADVLKTLEGWAKSNKIPTEDDLYKLVTKE